MIFTDLTIERGIVRSRRVQNSYELPDKDIADCRSLLKQLRTGIAELCHSTVDVPPFYISLGSPPWINGGLIGQDDHRNKIFCLRHPNSVRPFQICAALGPSSERYDRNHPGSDDRAAAIVVAISNGEGDVDEVFDRFSTTVAEIMRRRPVLAASYDPSGLDITSSSVETVKAAADFSTCFAAAMLMDGP